VKETQTDRDRDRDRDRVSEWVRMKEGEGAREREERESVCLCVLNSIGIGPRPPCPTRARRSVPFKPPAPHALTRGRQSVLASAADSLDSLRPLRRQNLQVPAALLDELL
jgi:hypothetical protein